MTDKQISGTYNSDLCLFDGINNYHVFDRMVLPKENETSKTFAGKSDAAGFIVGCLENMQNDQLIRDFLETRNIKCRNIYSRRELADLATDQISAYPLIAVPVSETQSSGGSGSSQEEEKAEKKDWPLPLFAFSKKHIKFKFIDKKSGQPANGVAARITDSNGNYKDVFSDKTGLVEWDGAKTGVCSLSSIDSKQSDYTLKNTLNFSKNEITSTTDQGGSENTAGSESRSNKTQKYYLATITQHKVSDGETLQSIAEKNHMTFSELAYFNWGSRNKKTILDYMRRDIGCSKLTHTSSDFNFEDSNKPGVVFIPDSFKAEHFQINQTHTVNVVAAGFHIFHESFQVIIKDDNGQPLKDITCELKQPDGTITIETTDKNGRISLSGINVKKTKIRVLEHDSYTAGKGA